MKLIDFINMVIKENFRPRKIEFNGFEYVLVPNGSNYCEFDYYCNSASNYLFLSDLDILIYEANKEVKIVEE